MPTIKIKNPEEKCYTCKGAVLGRYKFMQNLVDNDIKNNSLKYCELDILQC